MSRHRSAHFRSRLQISCRDTVSHAQPQARSRHQNQVATSWTTNLCRDIVSMSRPPTLPPMLRHQSMTRLQFPTGQVATLIPSRYLLKTNLCRDINFMSRPPFCHSKISRSRHQHQGRDLPHCYPCRDLKVMSRHPIQPAATQPGRDVPFLAATSRPTTPGRDFITMFRPMKMVSLSTDGIHLRIKPLPINRLERVLQQIRKSSRYNSFNHKELKG